MKKSLKKLKKKFMQRETVFILHKKYSIIRAFQIFYYQYKTL